MKRSVLPLQGLAGIFLCAVLCLPVLVAADESSQEAPLDRAVRLYEAQDYEQAQALLQSIDASTLSAPEQQRLARYDELTDQAVKGFYRALNDLDDAEAAIVQSDFKTGKALLRQVVHNEFSTPALRAEAQHNMLVIARAERQRVQLASAQDQAAEDDAAKARQLVDNGMEAMAGGDYQAARDFFEAALELVPGHPDAVNGLEQVKLHQRVEAMPAGEPVRLIDRIQHKRNVLWQRTVATYRQAAQQVQEFVANDRYAEANRTLQFARETIEAGRQYADPLSKYESLKAEYTALADMVAQRERDYNERRAFDIREDLEQREEQRLFQLEQERERQVSLLMEQVDQKKEDRDYKGAVQVLRQILVIDPKNAEAEWLMEELEDIASIRWQVELNKTMEDQTRQVLIQAEEAKIPWSKDVNYPDDWLDIIRSPYRQTPGEYPLQSDDTEFEESFRSRIPEISFRDSTSFQEALETLAEAGDINIVPNWPDLALAGVVKSTPVSLELKDVSLKTALAEVLDQVEGGSSSTLGFAVRNGIVKVATDDYLNRDVFTRVYDVKDLVHPVEHYGDAPTFDLVRSREERLMDREDATALFANGRTAVDEDSVKYGDNINREELDELVNLIMTHVAPGTWYSQGGPRNITINARRDGNIVVTQTAASQREIFNLLNQLREDKAVQIAIEARFLTVSSNFLEDMGIDLNIILNAGNAGFDYQPTVAGPAVDPATGGALLLPRNFGRLGFTPNVPGVGSPITQGTVSQPYTNVAFVPQPTQSGNNWTPIPILSGVSQYARADQLTSDVAGSFAGAQLPPALSIAGSFLDNIQVDFLIRATQADNRTSTLIAPKLILTNGQQAWVAFTNEQNFVSELEPVVASGAAAQRPVIQTLPTGAVLNVQATASPDRRYVTMNLEPGFGRLIAINSFEFSTGPNVGVGAGGFVQLPIIQRTQVKTTVTIPDGGTLLVGGQKLTFENDIEAGVPVLSKIPILKRIYSSRAIVKDEQVLLILIKPSILIQQEQEELAFPTLGSLE